MDADKDRKTQLKDKINALAKTDKEPEEPTTTNCRRKQDCNTTGISVLTIK
jgi:hypothetical protein